jgi:hypothetical protein
MQATDMLGRSTAKWTALPMRMNFGNQMRLGDVLDLSFGYSELFFQLLESRHVTSSLGSCDFFLDFDSLGLKLYGFGSFLDLLELSTQRFHGLLIASSASILNGSLKLEAIFGKLNSLEVNASGLKLGTQGFEFRNIARETSFRDSSLNSSDFCFEGMSLDDNSGNFELFTKMFQLSW